MTNRAAITKTVESIERIEKLRDSYPNAGAISVPTADLNEVLSLARLTVTMKVGTSAAIHALGERHVDLERRPEPAPSLSPDAELTGIIATLRSEYADDTWLLNVSDRLEATAALAVCNHGG